MCLCQNQLCRTFWKAASQHLSANTRELYVTTAHNPYQIHRTFLKIFWILIVVQEKSKTILFVTYYWYIFEIKSSFFLLCVQAFGGFFETVIHWVARTSWIF